MSVSADVRAFHQREAAEAAKLYVGSLIQTDGIAWRQAVSEARENARQTLLATNYLRDIPQALCSSAKHLAVLRRMLAPPFSQDRFGHLCQAYKKSSENSGQSLASEIAAAIAAVVVRWLDPSLTIWLHEKREPTQPEMLACELATAHMIALQAFETRRRGTMSAKQEQAVATLLTSMGWTRAPAKLIGDRSVLPARRFMQKARFATLTKPQEVDIACGLGGTIVLALECKVTNDETNSVKRINDVLKKARAWQQHWGSFVRTAALLEGVVAYKDVERLLVERIDVFWSHRLGDFQDWVERHLIETS